jgi:hypothetical protein
MERSHPFTEPDPFGIFIGERLQHVESITQGVMNAMRYATRTTDRTSPASEVVAVHIGLSSHEADALVEAVRCFAAGA